jgi:site-specific DNA-methyltransferase (adenine-specific)
MKKKDLSQAAQSDNEETYIAYVNQRGVYFRSDCLTLLHGVESETINLCFVDPPFNLGKIYEDDRFYDLLAEEEYYDWCKEWLDELIRVLVPGGALCVYSFPKLAITLGYWLNERRDISYRSLIALKMKNGFPIKNRLHPALYTILYYVKNGAKPKFNVVRIKASTCRHCGKLLPSYGGYRSKYKKYEDPDGIPWVQISDFWNDTRPAIHDKSRRNRINELPVHIPERTILATTNEEDVVLDSFGGGGSTFHAAQVNNRFWIGCDIIDEPALSRFATIWGRQENQEINPKLYKCFRKDFVDGYLSSKLKNKVNPIAFAPLLHNGDNLIQKAANSKSRVLKE